MTATTNVIGLFLAGASTIADAISDPLVAARWDDPSVLEDQLVSGLSGHLARGAVWVAADYLHAESPEGPVDLESAGEYFAAFAPTSTAEANRAIRERGAAVASVGHHALVADLRARIELMEYEFPGISPDRLISVIAGKVMRLEDYLTTRIVEQAVHLDDLARSVEHDPWPLPDAHLSVAISVGLEIAERLHGRTGVLRAFYRGGFAGSVFPVL